jgi:hypothetical protein
MRPWIIAAGIPMLVLVLLRGNVGTDLPMYLWVIELIQSNGTYSFFFEPGFEYLILALSNITNDPTTIAKIIAVITSGFLFLGKWKTEISYQVIGLGIVPFFYFDMTMNGLRYGLGFAIVLFSIKSILIRQPFKFIALSFAAVSMQISSVYLSGLLQILLKPGRKYLIFMVLVIIIIALFGSDYLSEKVEANTNLFIQSATAGIAPLILSLIVLIGCWCDDFIRRGHRNSILVLVLLAIIAYGVTQFTYAGIRLQQLHYFLILLFVICVSELNERKNSKYILISLMLVSFLGMSFRLSNFYAGAGIGDAPFVPYKFYWEN